MFAHILSVRKGEYILLLNLWDKTMKVKSNLWSFVYGESHEKHKDKFLVELAAFIRKVELQAELLDVMDPGELY